MIFVNEYIKTVEGWLKKHAMDMLRMVLFGCAVYFALISQNLVNSMDGLWNNFILLIAGNAQLEGGFGRIWIC